MPKAGNTDQWDQASCKEIPETTGPCMCTILQYVHMFSAEAAAPLTGFFMVSGVASIPGKSRARQRGIQVAIICLGGCLLLPWGYPLTSGTSSQTLLATLPYQSASTTCFRSVKIGRLCTSMPDMNLHLSWRFSSRGGDAHANVAQGACAKQVNSKAGLFWQKKLRLSIPDQRPQTDLGHWALAAPHTPVANLLAASAACSSILHDLSLQRIQQNCFDRTYPSGRV